MGYRNNTTNIMIMESELIRLEERAGLLAKNYWLKIYNYDNQALKGIMNRLVILEDRYRFVNPRGKINIFTKSWKDLKKYKAKIERIVRYEIYNNNY